MDASALAFAIYGLFDQVTRVGLTIHSTLKNVKSFSADAEFMRIQVADEVQRIRQLRSLLLVPNKIIKDASLFDQLPQHGRQNLAALLYHVAGPLMGEFSDLWSQYLSSHSTLQEVQMQTLNSNQSLDEMIAEYERLQTEDSVGAQVKIRDKIRWALSDKEKAKSLVNELVETTRRIKDDIELFCFPLGILTNNATALHEDADAVGTGWAEDSRLIRLITDVPTLARENSEIDTRQLAFEDDADNSSSNSIKSAYYQSEPAIVQYRSYKADDTMDAPRSVSDNMLHLSTLLQQLNQFDETKFRTLRFHGFYQEMRLQRFGLVYGIPKTISNPESLTLKQLLSEPSPFLLDERFKSAHQLAVALSRFHRLNWVHKNLRSENILYFRNTRNSQELSGPWISGMTHARRDDGETSMMVDKSFERNVYRHPQRWNDPLRYRQVHDIYSLGVILLELGLWSVAQNNISPNLRTAGQRVRQGIPSIQLRTKIMEEFKELARTRLRVEMGKMYGEVALACLGSDFGVSVDELQGTELQKMFWQQVVERLRLATEALT